MTRNLKGVFIDRLSLTDTGLSIGIIKRAIVHTHKVLDEIDEKLVSVKVERISQILELSNLSSMIGNILGAAIEDYSGGRFKRNEPHKYPDLLAQNKTGKDIEIKISLEKNHPKGHLPKEGFYLTFRYVLIDGYRPYDKNKRGQIAQIWEVRHGYLEGKHFNVSNTDGDSGKTAPINKIGMEALNVIYVDIEHCPYSERGRIYKKYVALINKPSPMLNTPKKSKVKKSSTILPSGTILKIKPTIK